MKPHVLVLHAVGTNRDREAASACELAGATAEIVTVRALLQEPDASAAPRCWCCRAASPTAMTSGRA